MVADFRVRWDLSLVRIMAEERLFWEVGQAMKLVREAGFTVMRELCNTREAVFAVSRSRPGTCYEVIVFRGLEAQAVRVDETTLLLLDESQVGTSKWTGFALPVVRNVLGVDGEESRVLR